MGRNLTKLSNKVILSDGKMYFTKIDSSASFYSMLDDENATHLISAYDVEIETDRETSSYTKAVALDFCKENEETGKSQFIDVIICDLLGTFISDWY